MAKDEARLAVDIGGTFTDVALELAGEQVTAKVLTTPSAPERGVVEGIAEVLRQAAISATAIRLVLHGTTLATNALIERKGARTALLVTEGLRDSLEMAYENRFEQYDINVDRARPLVPRDLRLPVRERLSARGEVLLPLEEASVTALVPRLRDAEVESVAVGLLHSYSNPEHERRVGELLAEALPGVFLSLSSEVCPEIREYERQSTTAANAYVRPLMSRYLERLGRELASLGLDCPLLVMTSGGGLATIETAMRFPIRLVESGPAGGAILAARIAAERDLDRVISFDMGGTTAKLSLLDDKKPLASRTFEVDRAYRFKKGSGLPVRIPVIEMVEIGAGGGSLASLDSLGRLAVGPESAGAEPGPACYGRGGREPTVTDADLLLGRIQPASFASGGLQLDRAAASTALSSLGGELGLTETMAAFAISEVVDENMANAARVHAVEWGKDITQRTMVAFGGAAPLHAARLAEKLDLARVIVPRGAGVGSALGFLYAPVAYEVVRSRYQRLSAFSAVEANGIMLEMQGEARAVVRQGVSEDALLEETRKAFMRYLGQGHEIAVELPLRDLQERDAALLAKAFEAAYRTHYGRSIPGLDIEILSWTLTLSAPRATVDRVPEARREGTPCQPASTCKIFDPTLGRSLEAGLYLRSELAPGRWLEGPALIVEPQTATVVSPAFDAVIDAAGYIVLQRRERQEKVRHDQQ